MVLTSCLIKSGEQQVTRSFRKAKWKGQSKECFTGLSTDPSSPTSNLQQPPVAQAYTNSMQGAMLLLGQPANFHHKQRHGFLSQGMSASHLTGRPPVLATSHGCGWQAGQTPQRWPKKLSGSPVSCPTHHGPFPALHCSLWLGRSACPGAVLSSKWTVGREKWPRTIRENEDFYRNVQTTGDRRTAPDWPATVQDTAEGKQDASGDPSEPAQPTPCVCRRGQSWRRPWLKTPFCREWKSPSASLIWCLQRLTHWQGEDPGFCTETHKSSPAHKRWTLATLPCAHQQCCWGNLKRQEQLQSFGYEGGRHGGPQSHQQGGSPDQHPAHPASQHLAVLLTHLTWVFSLFNLMKRTLD